MSTIQLSLLCLALFYSTTLINTVSGNCPDEDETPSPFYHNSSVTAPIVCPIATDCKGWLEAGANKSGVYPINPDKGTPFQVYCDMETDGGGWTVFQRRQDGSVDFYRYWKDYEKGFGSLTGEFWLGLSKMHRVTQKGSNSLRVDLGDFEGNKNYSQYTTFSIGDSTSKYMLTVGGYSGIGGDSFNFHNGSKFSTRDNDNDKRSGGCATSYKGAWWFNNCFHSHLNGIYSHTPVVSTWTHIFWAGWKGAGIKYSLKFTEMKTRHN